MRVGLIGPYPPPRGGVSVHIKRLEEVLRDQEIMVSIFNINSVAKSCGWIRRKISHLKWFIKIFHGTSIDILHIHGGTLKEQALIIFIARLYRIKTLITFHSLREDYSKMVFWHRWLLSYIVNNTDYIITAGDNEKDKLVNWFKKKKCLSVIPAFIQPKGVETELPLQLRDFISSHRLIISANASSMDFYQGQDIYGLDMLVELCGRLSLHMDVGFVYCLTRVTDKVYFEKIKCRIKELGIEKAFYIVLDSIEFWLVLKKSHIFIRPTCTDSYGVSIAEALTLGIPSVASNVCKRPEGTILFQTRNSEDLYAKVLEIINDYDQYRANIKHLKIESCTTAIQRIYQNLVKR